eukprot:4822477-Karenia_brevis.AAC.1
MPPTHGPGSWVQWGPHRCTSWKWDGRCNGGKGQIRLKDHMGDAWQPNPQYGMGLLRQMLEEARVQLLWTKAAENRHG